MINTCCEQVFVKPLHDRINEFYFMGYAVDAAFYLSCAGVDVEEWEEVDALLEEIDFNECYSVPLFINETTANRKNGYFNGLEFRLLYKTADYWRISTLHDAFSSMQAYLNYEMVAVYRNNKACAIIGMSDNTVLRIVSSYGWLNHNDELKFSKVIKQWTKKNGLTLRKENMIEFREFL